MSNQYFWYKLIELLRKKDIIIDGLTIPFIIGAKKYLDPKLEINDDSIFNFLTEIVHSDTDERAVLKDCAGNQYIIALRSRQFCKENLSNARIFRNKKGNESLYVTNDVAYLGNSIREISESLNERYKGLFAKETFSWNDTRMSWNKLSEMEKQIVTEATMS
ncbi:MAG: hypothetical protein ABIN36_08520 [Ferruginibacter sp.]